MNNTNMPHIRVSLVAILLLLLLFPLTMQGCSGILWLGVVGIDWARTSDVEFHPFENSWVTKQQLGLVKSIMVKPFDGDPMMAERWRTVFQEITEHHIVGQPNSTTDQSQAHTQRQRAQSGNNGTSAMNCILIGSVVVQTPQSSFAGLKESSSQRLYLRLMTDSGVLLWRTELPYTVVRGARNLDETMTSKALLAHVREYENEIGLAGLGTIEVALQDSPHVERSMASAPSIE